MTDGDPDSGAAEPAWLDDMLRVTLTDIPVADAAWSPPPGLLNEIDRGIDDGWPDGQPPTVDELAAADGDAGPAHWASGDVSGEHGWTDPDVDLSPDLGHVHGWHHDDDHGGPNDPEPGPHI